MRAACNASIHHAGEKNQIFSSWQHQLEEHQIVSIDHHQIFRPSNIEKKAGMNN
jgi:hypothetical protein